LPGRIDQCSANQLIRTTVRRALTRYCRANLQALMPSYYTISSLAQLFGTLFLRISKHTILHVINFPAKL